jgi:peptide/nickel transport system ATP-binding protein
MLKLEDVSKLYRIGTFGGKELRAVDQVSFSMQAGEVVSLIGESGSGKTTIGKMVLRLLSVSSGKIIFNGEDISSLEGEALKGYYRQVQGVFQDPFSSYNPIFKADRVFSAIREEFYPQMPGEQWEDKIVHALHSVGLNPSEVMNKFPHQLSGGQLQRFLIARALLLDIRFLVADEIISMLDASTRIDVLNLLADLKTRGLSILFITHDLSLAHYISERALILFHGCTTEMGNIDRIFDHPQHPYTQMLMASVPRLDQKWQEEGELDESRKLAGQGCVYYARCPVSEAVCAQKRPALIEVEQNHYVACIHAIKKAHPEK